MLAIQGQPDGPVIVRYLRWREADDLDDREGAGGLGRRVQTMGPGAMSVGVFGSLPQQGRY